MPSEPSWTVEAGQSQHLFSLLHSIERVAVADFFFINNLFNFCSLSLSRGFLGCVEGKGKIVSPVSFERARARPPRPPILCAARAR